MDINALAKTIAAIIKADGSATVPGLGKFSVAKSSAKLSDDGTIIYPPKIELDFVQDYEEAGIDTIERYASLKRQRAAFQHSLSRQHDA